MEPLNMYEGERENVNMGGNRREARRRMMDRDKGRRKTSGTVV